MRLFAWWVGVFHAEVRRSRERRGGLNLEDAEGCRFFARCVGFFHAEVRRSRERRGGLNLEDAEGCRFFAWWIVVSARVKSACARSRSVKSEKLNMRLKFNTKY
jgi:hypothetical protein